jgi:uncharacterized membrane protein (TIGR02234 family)
MADPRRTFVPVLLPGVLGAALAAAASAKPWAGLGHAVGTLPMHAPGLESAGQVPLASALSLVALAGWGALLVTRGRVRRGIAVLGLLAALALVVVAVAGAWTAPHDLRHAVDSELALPSGSSATVDVGLTGWYWVALVAGLVTLGGFALAVRYATAWPAMASRYDAPGARPVPERPTTNQELWKAIDEGHDPTS